VTPSAIVANFALVNGVFVTPVTTYSGVVAVASAIKLTAWCRVDMAIAGTVDISWTFTGATVTSYQAGSCYANFTREPGNLYDKGLVKHIRPVSMSVLWTFMGETLHDGGQISAALCPGNSLRDNVLIDSSSASAPGSFQDFQSLGKVPGSYEGPMREGAYVMWLPEEQPHRNFYLPSEVSSVNYPPICISGRYSSTAGMNNITIGRMLIITNFEYETSSLVIPSFPAPVNPDEILIASVMLSKIRHAMSNPDHPGFLSRLASWIDKASVRGGQWASNLLGPLLRSLPAGLFQFGPSNKGTNPSFGSGSNSLFVGDRTLAVR